MSEKAYNTPQGAMFCEDCLVGEGVAWEVSRDFDAPSLCSVCREPLPVNLSDQGRLCVIRLIRVAIRTDTVSRNHRVWAKFYGITLEEILD